MKKYIIDHFEGSYAICEEENKTMSKIPKYKLPLGCKEGDTLVLDSDGMYRLDMSGHKANKSRIKNKMSRLFE